MGATGTTQENHTSGPAGSPSPSAMFDPAGAAAYIGGAESPLCILTLADWRCKGIGPAYIKVGRLVRYRQSDLDAWLQSRVVAAESR